MANHSPSYRIKQIDSEISLILRKIEIHKLSQKDRELLTELRQAMNDARTCSRDYEAAEDEQGRATNAAFSRKWLNKARKIILKTSEHDIFGAIEVAHLTAHIDQIIGDLK